jgi:hypothetical protein
MSWGVDARAGWDADVMRAAALQIDADSITVRNRPRVSILLGKTVARRQGEASVGDGVDPKKRSGPQH